ncbi:DUF421 domain-containing protein [Paenibacillus terrae]
MSFPSSFFAYLLCRNPNSILQLPLEKLNEVHFKAFIIALTGLYSVKAREILDGQPTILIKKGEILEKALAKQHLNIDDLIMLLRNKDVFSPKEVEFAILEPDGKLSVLRKEELLPATKKDIKATVTPIQRIPTELIIDGKIVEKNLITTNTRIRSHKKTQ